MKTQSTSAGERLPVVDIAKGLSITLVAFAHSELIVLLPNFNHALALIRVPLFFFLSGVFFNESRSFSRTAVGRADALLKPYFVTLVLLWLVSVERHTLTSSEELAHIFYGVSVHLRWQPLWFLPHLWLVSVVGWWVLRRTGAAGWPFAAKGALLLALLAVGANFIHWFWPWYPARLPHLSGVSGLPFSLDLLPVTMAYFLAGRFMRTPVERFRPITGLVLAAAVVFALIVGFTGAATNLADRQLVQPVFATAATVCGIYLALTLASLLQHVTPLRRLFCYLGGASLFILIFHYAIEDKCFKFLQGDLGVPFAVAATVAFLVSVALSLPIRLAILRSRFLAQLFVPFSALPRRAAATGPAGRPGHAPVASD